MGIGKKKTGFYRAEDDPEIWAKLRGEKEIYIDEAEGLANLFGVTFEYLFSDKISTLSDMPIVYYRWYDWNKKCKEEIAQNEGIRKIEQHLRKYPNLIEPMKEILTWSSEDLQALANSLREGKKGTVA